MNVLIIGTDKYPRGDAGAVREEALAKLFMSIGARAFVVGLGKSTQFKRESLDGVEYCSLRAAKETKLERYKNRLLYWSRLEKYVLGKSKKNDFILITGGSNSTYRHLKAYAKANGVQLLHDSVEWYSPEQFRFGKLAKAYREKNALNEKIIDLSFRVIAISRYLEAHFKSRDIRTVRIPVIMDVEQMPCEKQTDENTVRFFYAGMPGRKDYLAEIVGAFAMLRAEERARCRLTIAGITAQQLISDCGVSEENVKALDGCLKCLGRIPREQVLEQLSHADFTVLLRKNEQRYAKAGFPTKVVESLATATPVICNLSSDLELYLHDGYNSFLCAGCSSEQMLASIRKAATATYEQRKQMQQYARQTAEKHFHYRCYEDAVKRLLADESQVRDDL